MNTATDLLYELCPVCEGATPCNWCDDLGLVEHACETGGQCSIEQAGAVGWPPAAPSYLEPWDRDYA